MLRIRLRYHAAPMYITLHGRYRDKRSRIRQVHPFIPFPLNHSLYLDTVGHESMHSCGIEYRYFNTQLLIGEL